MFAFSRQTRDEASYQFRDIGFHGDRHLLSIVDDIVVRESIEYFIETGTNVGSTVLYLARRYPHIKAFSCEQDAEAHRRARVHARGTANVQLHHANSVDFLKGLAALPELLRGRCFFWLDAHGYGFQWPLRDEVRFIADNFATAFVAVDDFRVPGLECFRYDEYQGQSCSYDYIRDDLGSRAHQLFYPTYSEHTSPHHPLIGWGLIVLGTRYEPDSRLAGLMSEAARGDA